MNVSKLRKLQKWILAEPLRFDMQEWSNDKLAEERKTPCGTVGCLAGMTCHMEGHELEDMRGSDDGGSIPETARQILDLNVGESQRLFFLPSAHHMRMVQKWPAKFDAQYQKAKTPLGRVRVAIRRIDHFIKTKGAE